jgi:hypothetical protein
LAKGALAALLPAEAVSSSSLEEKLLDNLCRRCFLYFWEQSSTHTGITRDRARADGTTYPADGRHVGSTDATGFALTAFCIGVERGWLSRMQARHRTEAALRSYAHGPVTNEHGWFYHFLDIRTGARYRASEVSTSDSTWLLAGALTAREYFRDDPEIVRLATEIYERVDYRWMLNQHPYFLAHGWTPEAGFIPYRYDKYCQLACMYLLGIFTHACAPSRSLVCLGPRAVPVPGWSYQFRRARRLSDVGRAAAHWPTRWVTGALCPRRIAHVCAGRLCAGATGYENAFRAAHL